MEQGPDLYENQKLPVTAGEIDYVLLTHAHIDHSGNIPLLCKEGFSGDVVTTFATSDLCSIMLRDSAHIQEFEAQWRNRKARRSGGELYEPVYTMADADAAIRLFAPCDYGQLIDLCEGIRVRFNDVGHLLGSASIEVWVTEGDLTKKVVFSGDVGNTNQPIIKDPQPVREADYVVIESTYGDRLHGDEIPDYVSEFTGILKDTFDKGGNVVIPSFAVGRTQELLYFIREIKEKNLLPEYPSFEVYVDSPLAIEATTVFNKNVQSCFDEEAMALVDQGINPLIFPELKTSITTEESKQINLDERPQGHHLRLRHVRGGPDPPPSEAQPLAQRVHGLLCGIPGGGHPRAQAAGGRPGGEALRGDDLGERPDRVHQGHQRPRGQKRTAALAGRL